MIYYALVFLAGLMFSIGLILLQKPFFSFALATTALLNAILDSDSDEDTKQKNLIQKLGPLLKNMLLFLVLFLVVIAISSIPITGYFSLNSNARPDLSSAYFYIILGVGSVVPFLVKPKNTEGDYSEWSKLLHRMVLDNRYIGKALFAVERKLFSSKLKEEDRPFVVVSGLARAGTTALTNLLFSSGEFHSLSYNNMPFLLAPNIWKTFYRPNSNVLKERAHGDKVQFGYSTIEALEEYFFSAFLPYTYVTDNSLEQHEVDAKTTTAYGQYRKLIADSGSTTYLAKNNNLILRYSSLAKLEPNMKVVLIVRNPLDHAQSLLNQHQRFCKLHQEDPFALEYMNWLKHHEFGANHKPFNLSEKENEEDPFELSYWVNSWIDYHEYVLSIPANENLILVDYLDLLNRPKELLIALQSKLELDLSAENIMQFKGESKHIDFKDTRILERANATYAKLRERTLSV